MKRVLITVLLLPLLSMPTQPQGVSDCYEIPRGLWCNYRLHGEVDWIASNELRIRALRESLVIRLASQSADDGSGMTEAEIANADRLIKSTSELLHNYASSIFVQALEVKNRLRHAHVRTRPFIAKLEKLDEVGAWACSGNVSRSSGPREIKVSTALIIRAAKASIKSALTSLQKEHRDGPLGIKLSNLENSEDLKNTSDVLRNIGTLQPFSVCRSELAREGLHVLLGKPISTISMLWDLEKIHTLAVIHFVKLLTFVLGHEASHVWIDNCPAFGSMVNEVRADDYGLMLSSLLFDEHLLAALLEIPKRDLLLPARLQQLTTGRSIARRKVRENRLDCNEITDERYLSEQGRLNRCYCRWSSLTDAKLADGASRFLYDELEELDKEISRLRMSESEFPIVERGFELFSEMYEQIGLKEYLSGNSTHMSIADRKRRSNNLYGGQGLIVRRVMETALRGKLRMSESIATKGRNFVAPLLVPVYLEEWLKKTACVNTVRTTDIAKSSKDPCISRLDLGTDDW